MQLTEHFSLEELVFSSTAMRKGINNAPPPIIVERLRVLATGLENVRALLGHPMHIDSGYRCVELNAAVGGSKTSAHMLGYAADFVCPSFGNPLEIVRAISASDLVFDQCIQEGTWVHISFDPKSRRDVLTAIFGEDGTLYRKGV